MAAPQGCNESLLSVPKGHVALVSAVLECIFRICGAIPPSVTVKKLMLS